MRHLLQTQGPGWLAFRILYAAKARSGHLRRRQPVSSWEEQPLAGFLREPALAEPSAYHAQRRDHAPPFFFSPGDRQSSAETLKAWDRGGADPTLPMMDLGRGVLSYFGATPVRIGSPPAWFVNPFTGWKSPAACHWTDISDFGGDDIKVIWEPSRFEFAFGLTRAYWRTGDESYAELFWSLLDDWREHNPPQRGPNWKCGQEISLRIMAWCFSLYGLWNSQASTPARVAAMAQMIAVSAGRIEANLGYALSQRNNHGISEGLGLWTIGLLFPEFHDADRWRERGRRVLESLGRGLIADDGSFSQHSVNYHRLMLHAYLWSVRLGDLHGHPLSEELRARVARAGDFLLQIQDDDTGRVPNYGPNDGALILPLNNCDYTDFRPVVQAAGYLATGKRTFPPGPWDEDLFWLFGNAALRAPVVSPVRVDLQAQPGGYYSLRSATGFAFTRCARFRHRPGQADLLHVDLWWRGVNVAIDPGTYSYNARPPWNNSLSHTEFHNTVGVDGLSQMEQASRFLWLPWASGSRRHQMQGAAGMVAYWEGQHDGYRRLSDPVDHRRAILRLGLEDWVILDVLNGKEIHDYRLHWLLPDLARSTEASQGDEHGSSEACIVLETPGGPYAVQAGCLDGPVATTMVRADVDSPRGWSSVYYMSRQPALSLALTRRGTGARFWTHFGPPARTITVSQVGLRVVAPDWAVEITLGKADHLPLATRVAASGGSKYFMEIPS